MADRGAARRRRFTVDSLFTDTRPQAVGVRDLVEAKEIQLDRIRSDPTQPRQTFDQDKLEELAASIRLEGVLQPIVVRYEPGRDIYFVVHGDRRLRASRLAGVESIPALVRDVPIERRLIQQLMENIVRDELNALDRASALRALKAQLRDAPWEAVAEAVGIRRSRLFQLLGTEKLPEAAQEDIRAGRLSEKQSRALQGLPAVAQEALREAIVAESIPAEEASRVARSLRAEPLPESPAAIGERVRQLRAEPAPVSAPPSRTTDGIRQVGRAEDPQSLSPNPAPAPAVAPPHGRMPAQDHPAGATAAEATPAPSPASFEAVAWREALGGLLGDDVLARAFDPDRVRSAIVELAAALRDAEGDDLRDGALTRDLVALRSAIDGALGA